MKKYILKGVTQKAKNSLGKDSIEYLESKIGCAADLYGSKSTVDGGARFILDGNGWLFHSMFLIVEEVIEEMNPKGKGMTLIEFILDRNYPVVISADDGSTQFRPGLVEEIFEEYLSYRINDSLKPKTK